MSELRWNPLLGEWTMTATHRQDRTFLPPADFCPLCPTKPGGIETEVPADGFQIVVFENRFPSLRRETVHTNYYKHGTVSRASGARRL
jgi:UDPglucose--hexose-1-phosphate uridylyltransferase